MSKYERIVGFIKDQIRDGELKPGDRLPSYGDLKAQFSVSYGSVRSALLVLKTEGVVESRQGDGVFVKLPG